MNWTDILADPSLQDLPYKIETNGYCQIVMSPASNRHAEYQGEITALLRALVIGGRAIVECSVQTTEGVKVPDSAWASRSFLDAHRGEDPYSNAPEICVAVLSPSNSRAEINEKKALYFAAGAIEVWTCDKQGDMSFYSARGSIDPSALAPDFPARVELG